MAAQNNPLLLLGAGAVLALIVAGVVLFGLPPAMEKTAGPDGSLGGNETEKPAPQEELPPVEVPPAETPVLNTPEPPASSGEESQGTAETVSTESPYPEFDHSLVESGPVRYYGTREGFLAQPKKAGTYPGVVMIHGWWGLNDNIKEMAERLASEGYAVLAVDLFKGKVADTPTEALSLVNGLDEGEALQNMKAAITHLRATGVTQFASLGWGFGGGQSMQLTLSGTHLDATVIYYGDLVTEAVRLQGISWPVLGVFGEEDQTVVVQSARDFQSSLNLRGITNEIYIYPGVGHDFMNPDQSSFSPAEAKDAWEKTLAFLEKNLKG